MRYIAKRTLHHKNRFIHKGGIVPPDYKRLTEGLRGGWIIQVKDPATGSAKKAPPRKTVEKPKPREKPIDPPAPVGERMEDIEYLNPMARTSLLNSGIISIADLKGKTTEDLRQLKGIGAKLAARLIADYEAYEAKEGIPEMIQDSEYSDIPAEDQPVSYNAEKEFPRD